ncbi:phosphoribosylformylglycinamidine synthase isoform X2 [Carex rostrata]
MSTRTLVRYSSVLLSECRRSSFPHLSAPPSRVRVPRQNPFFPLRCSHGDSHPASSDEQDPPQEAVLKAISEVSKSEGRVAQTTNVIIGGTVADDSTNEWIALDKKVNSYPTVRGFTAIGSGGDDFVQSMVVAVESVLQEPIPEGRVSRRLSERGKYVSVNIGPIRVISSEQKNGLQIHS